MDCWIDSRLITTKPPSHQENPKYLLGLCALVANQFNDRNDAMEDLKVTLTELTTKIDRIMERL
jgi:hypothetical protein